MLTKLIIKYYLFIKIIFIITTTCILFYAYFFSDKISSWETLRDNYSNPKMYLCLIISILVSFWIANGILIKKKAEENTNNSHSKDA